MLNASTPVRRPRQRISLSRDFSSDPTHYTVPSESTIYAAADFNTSDLYTAMMFPPPPSSK